METLSKDVIGLIFHHLTPLDWICTSVVCKSWWFVISKWMKMRKIQFIKRLRDEVNLFGIYLPEQKNFLCLRPLYYLQNLSTGCKGNTHDYLCARHRILSSYNTEICEICLENPCSIKCFGNRCDALKCRDYLYVLRNGKAVKVLAYPCSVSECNKKTDEKGGLCFSHAVKIISDGNDSYLTEESQKEVACKYPCLGMTKNNTRCRNKTSSRLSKCHQHIFTPFSLL